MEKSASSNFSEVIHGGRGSRLERCLVAQCGDVFVRHAVAKNDEIFHIVSYSRFVRFLFHL